MGYRTSFHPILSDVVKCADFNGVISFQIKAQMADILPGTQCMGGSSEKECRQKMAFAAWWTSIIDAHRQHSCLVFFLFFWVIICVTLRLFNPAY